MPGELRPHLLARKEQQTRFLGQVGGPQLVFGDPGDLVGEVAVHREPLEALARIREGEGRLDEAARLLRRTVALKEEPAAEWVRLGELEMGMGNTPAAIMAFEEARDLQAGAFDRNLELGVCYLAMNRPAEAADLLDLVPPEHPGYALALFKRAQVSVLLGEPDWQRRVRFAYDRADPDVRRLIRSESLFRGVALP